MDYTQLEKDGYFVDPTSTGYGSLPTCLTECLSSMKVRPYAGERPMWMPSTEKVREYLMHHCWGGNYKSRSKVWVIGHNGSPLSEDSIQIDHIIPWESIKEKLLYTYCGKNAWKTPFTQLVMLPHPDGKLIKGIDYIDDPEIVPIWGEDVLYKFTNIAAIKYFHTIENLRPLPGSINSRRNNVNRTDPDLRIVHPTNIDIPLMTKLSELAASVEEYIAQVVHLTESYTDPHDRSIHIDTFMEKTNELISHLYDVNRSEFE